jgi:hypothetical protein
MENEHHSAPRLDEAVAFFETTLADGARLVADVKHDAAELGIKDHTLHRALTKLGIKPRIRKGTAALGRPGVWEYPGVNDTGAGA